MVSTDRTLEAEKQAEDGEAPTGHQLTSAGGSYPKILTILFADFSQPTKMVSPKQEERGLSLNISN